MARVYLMANNMYVYMPSFIIQTIQIHCFKNSNYNFKTNLYSTRYEGWNDNNSTNLKKNVRYNSRLCT